MLDTATAKRASLAQEAEANRRKAAQGGTSAAAYTAVATKMDAVIKRFDDFVTRLRMPDANGQVPFLAIARQADLSKRLKDGGFLIFVKSSFQGGTTYSKKNFFTFFGGMPFYASGGVLASFAIIQGPTGKTIDFGDTQDVTPFTAISRIGRRARPAN